MSFGTHNPVDRRRRRTKAENEVALNSRDRVRWQRHAARQQLLEGFLSGDAPAPTAQQRYQLKKNAIQFRPEAQRTRKLLALAGADLVGGGHHRTKSASCQSQSPSALSFSDAENALSQDMAADLRALENGTKSGVHPKVSGLLHSLYDIDMESQHSRQLPALNLESPSQPGKAPDSASLAQSAARASASRRENSGPSPPQSAGTRKLRLNNMPNSKPPTKTKLSPIAARRSARRRRSPATSPRGQRRSSPTGFDSVSNQSTKGSTARAQSETKKDRKSKSKSTSPSNSEQPEPKSPSNNKKTDKLIAAVKDGDVIQVEDLVRAKVNINYSAGRHRDPALVVAVAQDNLAMVQCLCRLKADPHLLDRHGQQSAIDHLIDKPDDCGVKGEIMAVLSESGTLKDGELPLNVLESFYEAHHQREVKKRRYQVLVPEGVAVRRRPTFSEPVDDANHPWLELGTVVRAVSEQQVQDLCVVPTPPSRGQEEKKESEHALVDEAGWSSARGGYRTVFLHDAKNTSMQRPERTQRITTVWVEIPPIFHEPTSPADSAEAKSDSSLPFRWVPITRLRQMNLDNELEARLFCEDDRPMTSVMAPYEPFDTAFEYHEWAIHDVVPRTRGTHAYMDKTSSSSYISVGDNKALQQAMVESAHWMNVYEQAVWQQYVAEVNDNDFLEQWRRDSIIRERGGHQGVVTTASSRHIDPPRPIAQFLGVFTEADKPNEFGELLEKVELSDVYYGLNRRYVFRVRIPSFMIPEFFSAQKLHRLSLASWQHFKSTGDDALRAVAVSAPLGDPRSKPLTDVQQDDSSTNSLSRNKFQRQGHNPPAISSMKSLRQEIAAVEHATKRRPTRLLRLPPQLRELYAEQAKHNERGVQINHISPAFDDELELAEVETQPRRGRARIVRRRKLQAYVNAFEFAHNTLAAEREKARREREQKALQEEEQQRLQQEGSSFFGKIKILTRLRVQFRQLVADQRDKHNGDDDDVDDGDSSFMVFPGLKPNANVADVTKLRAGKFSDALRKEKLLHVDVRIRDYSIDATGRQMTDRYMPALVEALQTTKFVRLSQNMFTFQGLRILTRAFSKYNVNGCGLLHLDLSHNRLGTHGAQVLAGALRVERSKMISTIRKSAGVAPGSLVSKAFPVPLLSSLRVLKLRDNGISEAGTDAICEAISSTKVLLSQWSQQPNWEHVGLQLVALDLSRNEVGLTGIKAIEKIVRKQNHGSHGGLERLELSWTTLSIPAATVLWKFVSKAASLLHLDVSWNAGAFHREALDAFCAMLKSKTSLRHLNMANSGIILPNVHLRIAQALQNNHTLLGLHVSGNGGLHLDNFGFLHSADDEVGVTTSTAPMVHPRTKLAAALAKTTLITMANRRQVDDLSEVEHLQQEEEAAQLSQIANHEKDNGWHSTGPQCWICARWREVCFEVHPSDISLPPAFADNPKVQDTTDYMFQVYLCCEVDGWQPVQMHRVPGAGFQLFRIIPPSPSPTTHEHSARHWHTHDILSMQRYFYMVHVVYFAKQQKPDLQPNRRGNIYKPAPPQASTMLCFVKHSSKRVNSVNTATDATDGVLNAFPFSRAEQARGHHVHLEFKDKNGESHREEAPFPAFFHKFPVSHQFEAGNPKFQDPPAAWWGKDFENEAYDETDKGLQRIPSLAATVRKALSTTSMQAWDLFRRSDCVLSDAFEADWAHSKIAELVRTKVKVQIQNGRSKFAGSLVESADTRVVESGTDVQQAINAVKTTLRKKYIDIQNMFRCCLKRSTNLFLLALPDFIEFAKQILLLDTVQMANAAAASTEASRRSNVLRRLRVDDAPFVPSQQVGPALPPVSLSSDTLERLFWATNITPDYNQQVHRNNKQRLTRYEFMELLVRCAVEVSSKILTEETKKLRLAGLIVGGDERSVGEPEAPPVADMIETLWQLYIVPRAKFSDPQFFRSTLMYNESIHRILKKHEKSLQKLFQHFAAVEIADEESKQQSSQRKSAAFLHWTFNQYMEFGRELKRHGILEQSVSEHMQRTIFLHTAPLETDEAMSDRHRQLSFTEWLEAVCRLCHTQAKVTSDHRQGGLTPANLEPFLKSIVDCKLLFR